MFLIFPRKQTDVQSKVSPKVIICMKCQRIFSDNNNKLYFKMASANFSQHAKDDFCMSLIFKSAFGIILL